MQKLSTFDVARDESTYFATIAMKNAMAIQAIANHLNVMTEAINELINNNSSIDLEAFKKTFLKELATLLEQDTEFEFSNSLFDLLGTERASLNGNFRLLELQFQALTERVSKIELALGHEKVKKIEESDISDYPF